MSWFSDFREFRKAKRISRMTFPGSQYGSTGESALAESILAMMGISTGSTKINFHQEVGDLRNSSLVMSVVNWVARSLNSARLRVITLDADNKETEVKNHPLPALWENPNPMYSGMQLWSGVALSNVIDATAYVLKIRNRIGQINQLWYEPHWTIRPRWPQTGSEFISYYEIERNGVWERIEVDDVFVTRDGLNAETRRGQSPTSALIKEYYTDLQAAKFSAQLLRSGLVPPVIISVGDKEHAMSKDVFTVFRRDAESRFSGDGAGKPFFINGPANVEKLGFEYSKVGMKEIRQMPEERVCSVMGISPHSLHFQTTSETYDNVRQFLRYDYISYVVQMHKRLADDITRDDQSPMGAHLLQDGEVLDWDYSDVELMQLDTSAEWERVGNAFKNRIIDQAEARDAIGYKFDDSHVGVYFPVQSSMLTLSPLEEKPEPRVQVGLQRMDEPKQLEPGDEEKSIDLDSITEPAVRRLQRTIVGLPSDLEWDEAKIATEIAFRNVQGAVDALPFEALDAELEEVLHLAILNTVEQAGTKALESLPVRQFDVKNPMVGQWAERRAAEQVTLIGQESRLAIRHLISQAVMEGVDAKTTARLIRAFIGLNERQAIAITALRAKLLGQGTKPERIETLIASATKRAMKQRAEMIARTEIQAAANHGLQEGWRQAAAKGLLDPTRTRRTWILSSDACPICHSIKDSNADMGLEGTWAGGEGTIEVPPAHPNCRCTMGLEFL